MLWTVILNAGPWPCHHRCFELILFSHWLSLVLLHKLQELKQSQRSFPPERLNQLLWLKWALCLSRCPPSDTAILPPAAWWVHGWHRCGVPGLNTDATVKNPAACLPLYVFSLFLKKYVFCACMCARFQTPVRGLKMPLHPREEAVGSESQHICDWSDVLLQLYTYLYICIHLIFLFISSFNPNVPLFLSVELIFAHAYHFSSLSSPLSVLQLCFLHTSSLSQSTPIPFLLFSLLFPVSALSFPLFASIVTQRGR